MTAPHSLTEVLLSALVLIASGFCATLLNRPAAALAVVKIK